METRISPIETPIDKIRPAELSHVINHFHSKIKFLSLDCFDTLIWRMTATPQDVFFIAEHSSAFKSIGLTATLRVQAEAKARQLRGFSQNISEVSLADIYREYLPSITEQQLNDLIAAEIASEQAVCYVFPSILELIRKMHAEGIKIIIVSDTYFNENQLRLLLTHVLPADVMQMIEMIFCSSQYEKSKSSGLFNVVLHQIKEKPESFLHIGDNLTADYISARALKLNALHFIQDQEYQANHQRLHSIAANLINPAIRGSQPLFNPFRGVFSMTGIAESKPEFLIGYYSLGPVMYCFAQFILKEIEGIRCAGKNPKVLFLMRDGYLPWLACQALAGEFIGDAVNISRFSAYAASFKTQEDIDRYVAGLIKSNRFEDLCRQLLLPKKVSDPLLKVLEKSIDPREEFIRFIHRSDISRIIFKKSAEYRQRLMRYLENKISLKSGDTLVFVDLGYAGTAQRQLAPIFKEMNVELEGRYLIALGASIKERRRVGLLDKSHYDDKTLFAIVHFISLLEQLCTSNEKSVMDYDEEGNLIYSDIEMNQQQHQKLLSIQNECLQFIQRAKNFFHIVSGKLTADISREYVLAELSRMIFLPTGPELHYLQSFQFDLNLGTKDIYPLFDPKKGLDGLKRRGLFYIDKHANSRRTHYPAELRIAGFELALTFMSYIRFNLDMNFDDMFARKELLQVQIQTQYGTRSVTLAAVSTHDGYYSVWMDMVASIKLFIGSRYQWIQIESAELISHEAFIEQKESGFTQNVKDYLLLENVIDHGGGLLQCLSEHSAVTLLSNIVPNDTQNIFRLVYRPLIFNKC